MEPTAARKEPMLMIALTVLLGFLIERAAYKPLRTAPRMSVMISAIENRAVPKELRQRRSFGTAP